MSLVHDLADQLRNDQRLSPRESWYRDLFELAGDGIFLADLDGRYADVNRAGCELLGYSRDELVGKTIVELIPADEVPRLEAERDRMLAGAPHVSEWRLRHKDGTLIPVEVSAKILADGRWLGFVRDLRARKAAEEARRLDEQRLRVALASAPISMFNQDRELRYTWSYNPPAPYRPEDILGKHQEDVAAPPLASHLIELKRRVLETGEPTRTLIANELPSGRRWFDLTIEPLRDTDGNIVGLTGAAWDVTERKRDEDASRLLADASALFEAEIADWKLLLRRIAPLGLRLPADLCIIDALDEDGRTFRLDVVHADPAKAELAAALARQPIGSDGPHLAGEALRTMSPVLIEDVSLTYLRTAARSAEHLAQLRALELTSLLAVPLVSRGRAVGMLVLGSSSRRLGHDDLELAIELGRRVALAVDTLRLQNALQRAVAARDEALAIVAHDLRNPLNSVLLQSEILSDTIDEGSAQGLAIDRIRYAARRMNRLIQDLLDVVRLDAREPLQVVLAIAHPDHVVDEAVDSMRPLAAASLVELAAVREPGLPAIQADHDRLLQVFENLIGNAIKFSSRGARVTVSATRRDDTVVFSVSDRGPGIGEAQLAHLFDRFWQGNRGDRRGIGLGLFVVKGIIEAHRGRIWVESKPGAGTTFHVALPIAPHEAA